MYRDPHFHFPGPPHGSQMTWTLSCAWLALSSSLAGGPCSSTVSCCARTHTTYMSGTSAWPCTRAVPGRCVTALYPQESCPPPHLHLPWPQTSRLTQSPPPNIFLVHGKKMNSVPKINSAPSLCDKATIFLTGLCTGI